MSRGRSLGDAEQFKALGVVHAILSDETKRRNYDASGDIDTHDLSEEAEHWYNYFRELFPRVTVESIDKFRCEYRLSEEERRDVIECHHTFRGDFAAVMENIMLAEDEDAQRIADIIQGAIENREIHDHVQTFHRTSKIVLGRASKEVAKKKRKSTAEAVEDEELRLRELQLMMQKNSRSRASALDGLLEKYGGAGGSNNSGKKKGNSGPVQRAGCDVPDDEFEAIQSRLMNKAHASNSKKQKK